MVLNPTICEGFGEAPWIPYISNDGFENLSDEEKEKYIVFWTDVTRYQSPSKAVFAINKDFIDYCENHQKHFYTHKGCFHCKHLPDFQQKVNMNLEEHKWIGWY